MLRLHLIDLGGVYIADGGHLDLRIIGEKIHIVLAAIAGADDAVANFVVGSLNARIGSGGHGDSRAAQQVPPGGYSAHLAHMLSEKGAAAHYRRGRGLCAWL